MSKKKDSECQNTTASNNETLASPASKSRLYVLHQSLRGTASQTPVAGVPLGDGQDRTAPLAPGLSKCHNRTEGWSAAPIGERRRRITVHHGAGLVHIESRQRDTPADPERQAKRGKITAWSAKSRMHCRTLLCSLRREALQGALFATLTYPSVFPAPDDHGVYKAICTASARSCAADIPLCVGSGSSSSRPGAPLIFICS